MVLPKPVNSHGLVIQPSVYTVQGLVDFKTAQKCYPNQRGYWLTVKLIKTD